MLTTLCFHKIGTTKREKNTHVYHPKAKPTIASVIAVLTPAMMATPYIESAGSTVAASNRWIDRGFSVVPESSPELNKTED